MLSITIRVRLSSPEYAALRRLAHDDARSIASMARLLILAGMRARGVDARAPVSGAHDVVYEARDE